MQNSKLPFRYCFIAMHLATLTKNAFSSTELQHKRYQPIWEMANKLRDVMGQRDALYKLEDEIEFDYAFFTT